MNDLHARRQILAQASQLLGPNATGSTDELLYRLGQVQRLSCTDGDDSDEAAQIVVEADQLVERLTAAAQTRSLAHLAVPDLSATHTWLESPRGSHAPVLDSLDRLGALKAALALLAHGSPLEQQLDVATNELERRIGDAITRDASALFDLGVAALERIATHGHVPGQDRALVALDGAVHQRLQAALRGEPLEAPRPFQVRSMPSAQAEALGRALATALQRDQPLRVAPDLLELTGFPRATASRRSHDLQLHNATPDAAAQPSIELMRGVRVTLGDDEIEVELLRDVDGPVMLVPLVHGEPKKPCSSRSGHHPRHFVFTPAEPQDGLDGYALVIGDQLAFLKLGLAAAARPSRPGPHRPRRREDDALSRRAPRPPSARTSGRPARRSRSARPHR